MKEVFENVILFIFVVCAVFSLYIGMVLEPECEKKGYAGVDKNGCYIIQQEKRVYSILS